MSDKDGTLSDSPPKRSDDENPDNTTRPSLEKSHDENSSKPVGASPEKSDDENSAKAEGTCLVKSDDWNSAKAEGTSLVKSDDGNSAKAEGTSPVKSDDQNSAKAEGTSLVKSDDENSAKAEGTSLVKSDDENSAKAEGTSLVKSDDENSAKAEGTSPVKSDDENSAKATGTTTVKKQYILVVSHSESLKIWKMNDHDPLEEIDTSVPEGVGSCHHSVCKYTDNGLMITGGVNSKVCLKWTATSNMWERLQDMPRDRYYHASICTEDQLLVIGGIVDGCNWSQDVQELALDWRIWGDGRPMPLLLSSLKVAKIRSHVYVLGNMDTSLKAGLLCLETKRMTWSVKTGIENAGSDFSLVACDSRLLVAGGSKQICKSYNPLTDVWSHLAPPLSTHISGSMVVYKGHVVILGGHTSIVEKYHLSEKTWSRSDVSLPQDLEHHTSLVLDF